MDRREFLELFRERLEAVIATSGLSRSAFARNVGMDRSTLSQLLSPANDRLPRVETLAAIAAAQQISIDWLMGLSQSGNIGADILRQQLSIERGAVSPTDERLMRWHTEAIGYKIRYVPTTLPDLLKTEEVIHYELDQFTSTTPEQEIRSAAERLEYQRRPETDMEACTPIHVLREIANGEGFWRDLPERGRILQMEKMVALVEELYPTFRWFLFDGRQRFSVPITIFGPLRAAIYLGQMYLVVSSTRHIRELAEHFDDLIRGAVVQPTEIADYLRTLLDQIR